MQPEVDGTCLELDQAQLRKLLEKTAFAMAQHDVRYYLNGLLLEVRSGGLTTVATDGHRLAKVELDLETDVSEPMQVILPGKTVAELKRLLLGSDEKVRINLSERTIQLQLGATQVTSKLIDGRYPEYDRVIPRNPDRLAVADRSALRQALQRTAILSNEKYKGVRLTFDTGLLRLQAHNPEQDEAEEELELDYSSEPTTIGFNVAYVMDILGVLEKDEVEISFSDGNSSALWRTRVWTRRPTSSCPCGSSRPFLSLTLSRWGTVRADSAFDQRGMRRSYGNGRPPPLTLNPVLFVPLLACFGAGSGFEPPPGAS